MHPLTPARVLDTRIRLGYPSKVGPGGRIDLPILNQVGIPSSHVSPVVLNVTVTDGSQPSYLTPSAAGACVLGFSSLNFGPSEQGANLAFVTVGANGAISIYNSAGSVDVIADVFGWIGDASDTRPHGHYKSVSATRVHDTRQGSQGIGRLGPGQQATVAVAGQNGLPSSGASAVVLNLTAVDATQGSYLSVWPAGQPRPLTSNVNFGPGQQRANRIGGAARPQRRHRSLQLGRFG